METAVIQEDYPEWQAPAQRPLKNSMTWVQYQELIASDPEYEHRLTQMVNHDMRWLRRVMDALAPPPTAWQRLKKWWRTRWAQRT